MKTFGRKLWRRVWAVVSWPYLYHLMAAAGAVVALVSIETGHPLDHAGQVFWPVIVLVWIGLHAMMRHTYEMARRTGEQWRKLYELAAQKRRSIWS